MDGTRRRFLVWISTAAAAAAMPGWLVALSPPVSGVGRVVDRLTIDLRELVRGDGPRAVGRAYLREHPGEREAEVLVRLLLPPERRERFERAGPEARHEALRGWVSEDFRAGRIVRVEGWILARTEARLSALSSLA